MSSRTSNQAQQDASPTVAPLEQVARFSLTTAAASCEQRRQRRAERGVAQAQAAQVGGSRLAHEPVAVGGSVERQVVEDGEAAVGVDDEVDLDAGADGHGLDDAGGGEGDVVSAPVCPMPLEDGAPAVHDDVGRSRSPWQGGAAVWHGAETRK